MLMNKITEPSIKVNAGNKILLITNFTTSKSAFLFLIQNNGKKIKLPSTLLFEKRSCLIINLLKFWNENVVNIDTEKDIEMAAEEKQLLHFFKYPSPNSKGTGLKIVQGTSTNDVIESF